MLVILLDLTRAGGGRGLATGVCDGSSSPPSVELMDVRGSCSSRPEGEEITTIGAESDRGRVKPKVCLVGVVREETLVNARATGVRSGVPAWGARGVDANDSLVVLEVAGVAQTSEDET